MLRSLWLCSLLLVLGCGGGEEALGDPAKINYSSALGVDLAVMERHESGLYLQDLKVGTGDEASLGRRVTVHYTGWLPDGTQFDSSRQEGRTAYSFTPGETRVIAGWHEGIPGMKVGGVRKLVIPSSLGYGARGNGIIPPHSVLIFEVEVLSIP
ncbi:FKBP-type peptidyl-prolyl cis-trans isomerase [Hyalangium gracile]|uniref:FKBP-type peptidyl-prolyl cis-trans isomerase n=1 Tax=Hyalangium gracile TaxID=394092 RepID=UPI001CCFC27A|nr:FKBP-type peptidyl-prolyl cis-trans isomerase [Hyalangium gracile]